MKRVLLFFAAAMLLVGSLHATIKNPMLWADVPDPDVIRVGDTFYLVSTTMHLMPGAPVMASKDLQNWETVGYIFDKLTDSPKYDMQEGTVYGRGQWATSLKYHEGKFWALLAPNEAGAMGDTYIFTAPKAEGPWTIHSRLRHFHDATLFFDDDSTPYVFFGTGEMCQLTPDLKGVVEGSLRHYFQREEDERGLLEGTRVIKHNGTYYALLISHVFAPGRHRREVCYRTKDLNGVWEKNTILESDFGGFSYLAQGTIVDTEEGDWYGIMFQDRGGVGRVLTLSPVRWIDGWPMLGDENGKVPATMRPLKSNQPVTAIVGSDDFSVECRVESGESVECRVESVEFATAVPAAQKRSPVGNSQFSTLNSQLSTLNSQLKKLWQWNHNPINEAWSLTERPGFLRLKTNRVVPNLYLAPNTLTQRMEGPTCSGAVTLDLSHLKDGDCCGLAAFNGDSGVLTIKKKGRKLFLEMSEQKVSLTEREKAVTSVEEKVVESIDLSTLNSQFSARREATLRLRRTLNSQFSTLHLKLTADFRPGHHDVANFYYSIDGKEWKQIGTKNYQMRFDYRRFFMGTKFAIFCYATKKKGGYVDVDAFDYQRE